MRDRNRFLLVVALAIVAGLIACTEHVQDPWVAEGTMQEERHVAPSEAEELDVRLLSQSDR